MVLKSHPKFDLLLLERKLGQEVSPSGEPSKVCEQRSDMITSGSDTKNRFFDHCLHGSSPLPTLLQRHKKYCNKQRHTN